MKYPWVLPLSYWLYYWLHKRRWFLSSKTWCCISGHWVPTFRTNSVLVFICTSKLISSRHLKMRFWTAPFETTDSDYVLTHRRIPEELNPRLTQARELKIVFHRRIPEELNPRLTQARKLKIVFLPLGLIFVCFQLIYTQLSVVN